MRVVRVIAAVCALSVSASAFGQPPSPQASVAPGEWIVYVDRAERFTINFLGQPTIRETMYEPQRGPMLPGRIYTVQDGPRHYTVTVINYAGANVNDVPHAVALGSVELPEARRRDHLRRVRKCGPHQRPPAAYYLRG